MLTSLTGPLPGLICNARLGICTNDVWAEFHALLAVLLASNALYIWMATTSEGSLGQAGRYARHSVSGEHHQSLGFGKLYLY